MARAIIYPHKVKALREALPGTVKGFSESERVHLILLLRRYCDLLIRPSQLRDVSKAEQDARAADAALLKQLAERIEGGEY